MPNLANPIRFLFASCCVWLLGASLLSLLGLRLRRSPLQYAQPALDFAVGAAVLGSLWVSAALLGQGVSAPLILSVVAVVTAAALLSRSRRRPTPPPSLTLPPGGRALFTAVIGVILLLAMLGVAFTSLTEPLFWDGRYIWAFKAKAMFLDGRLDRETFSNLARYRYTALDHPLTVPALQAWVFQVLGKVDERYGKMVGLVYWLGIGAILVCYLRRRLSWPWALAFGGLVLHTPILAHYARSGGAEVAMGFHLLAAGVLLAEWQETRRREEAILAALLLGTGALVKPEGMSMLVGGILLFVLLGVRGSPRPRLRDFALVTAASLAPLLPWLALRVAWQIPSPMLTNLHLRPWEELAPRLTTIALEVLRQMANWRRWELSWVVIAVGLALSLCLRTRSGAARVMWWLAGWQLVVDVAVYALNPYDIQWTLEASLDRLMLQLLPLALLAAGLALLEGPRRFRVSLEASETPVAAGEPRAVF